MAFQESERYKTCANCGYQNKVKNRSCLKCGNPLPESTQTTAEEAPSFSPYGVVYLYGDHFVGGGFLGAGWNCPVEGSR